MGRGGGASLVGFDVDQLVLPGVCGADLALDGVVLRVGGVETAAGDFGTLGDDGVMKLGVLDDGAAAAGV